MSRIAVMGAGSWGTTFAQVCADAGSDVILWGRNPDLVSTINDEGRNPAYLPTVTLRGISATSVAADALEAADVVVLAVPSQSLRQNLTEWQSLLSGSSLVVSLMKGIERHTHMRMSEVIAEQTGLDAAQICVLSGPNLAHEIAARQPAATTIACVDDDAAALVQQACANAYFRPYRTTDVVGTELGGATKNVIALANGMAVGLGFGENAQAALITRGLAEMTRLGVALGASPMTFAGLAGMGDLVATCTSPLSRNRGFGVHLGQGRSVAEAEQAMTQTCEGVKSCQAILELAQENEVDMPITEQVVEVVHNGLQPVDMLSRFMSRDIKPEM
jgi:glycerol-3-phosphate dehydrogenase (NAD(P)+)